MPMRKLWIFAAVLILIACETPVSHSDTSVNSWPSPVGAPVRFITSDNLDLWPCFSPDGERILFSRRMEDSWEFLLVSVRGGPPQRLASSPLPVAATRANWSKQGLIAFTGTSLRGESGIWTIRSDGSFLRELRLTGLSNQMFYPTWFPDGEQVAAMDAQDLSIKRIDLRTGAVATITNNKQVFTGMPSVSPDGKQIAFAGQKNTGQQYDQSNNQIWLVDEAGVSRYLESAPSQGRAPTWSPSGSQLAFESNRGNTAGWYAIFIINRDGTGLTQITDRALNADHPVWSPDGRHLAFSARGSTKERERSIAIIDLPNN
jgi:Tol biopolymer transport system component